jgi:hypothetical protein
MPYNQAKEVKLDNMLVIFVEFNREVRLNDEGLEVEGVPKRPDRVPNRRVRTGTCAVKRRLFKTFW